MRKLQVKMILKKNGYGEKSDKPQLNIILSSLKNKTRRFKLTSI